MGRKDRIPEERTRANDRVSVSQSQKTAKDALKHAYKATLDATKALPRCQGGRRMT